MLFAPVLSVGAESLPASHHRGSTFDFERITYWLMLELFKKKQTTNRVCVGLGEVYCGKHEMFKIPSKTIEGVKNP